MGEPILVWIISQNDAFEKRS